MCCTLRLEFFSQSIIMESEKISKQIFIVAAAIFAAIGWYTATGFGKGQYVRLLDIFLYGPYLIYLATKTTYTFSNPEKLFLLLLGTTTISYNLRNYLGIY